jgi:hypothetical protein
LRLERPDHHDDLQPCFTGADRGFVLAIMVGMPLPKSHVRRRGSAVLVVAFTSFARLIGGGDAKPQPRPRCGSASTSSQLPDVRRVAAS